MILKKLYHGNINVCQAKKLLLASLLTIVFLLFYCLHDLDSCSHNLNSDITLKDCLFEGVKLSNITDKDKYVYSSYGIGFDLCSEFWLPDGSIGKNIIIFGVDVSSSVHIDNNKKDISILGRGLTQGLGDTALSAEAQYLIN